MRVGRHWADYLPADAPEPIAAADPYGHEIDRPGTTLLTLTADPCDAAMFRPCGADESGQLYYRRRDFYDLGTDATSLDDSGGRILIGNQCGSSTIGGGAPSRCIRPPLEGQWLQSDRIGSVKRPAEGEEQTSEKARVNDKDKARRVVYVQARRGRRHAADAPFVDPEIARRMWSGIAHAAREQTAAERAAG